MPLSSQPDREEAPPPRKPPTKEPNASRPSLATKLRRGLGALPLLREFGTRLILLRAAALTYLSIVSLVPLLTVGFMGIQVLGLVDLEEKAQAFIFDNLAVGVREEVAQHLSTLLTNARADVTSGGIVGVALLAFSAILLLRNVEKAFDELWGRKRMRPFRKQLGLYFSLLFAGPIVLGLSLAATAALKTWAAVYGVPFGQRILSMVPFALSVLGFSLLYKIAPASKVRWRAAAIAGFIAATLWEGAKVGYAAYAVSSFQSGSIYGSLAALPTFLVWIYLSWLIVLFGARLSFTIQHPERLQLAADPRTAAKAIEVCALKIALSCRREAAAGVAALAEELGFPDEMVRAAVQDLEEVGILRRSDRIQLGRDPAQIQVAEVIRAVRGRRSFAKAEEDRALERLLRLGDRAALEALTLDLEGLAAEIDEGTTSLAPTLASR